VSRLVVLEEQLLVLLTMPRPLAMSLSFMA
jgi:hypothetical protein